MNVNKVFILGNLTRDPEIRTTPSGAMVANLGVATNRVWFNQNREKKEEVEFHNVVLFGRNAEVVKQYLVKGRAVFVEGRLQTRNWQGQDGVKRYRTEVIGDRIQLGPRNYSSSGGWQNNQNNPVQNTGNQSFESASQNTPEQNRTDDLEVIEYPEEEIDPKDIPF